MPDKHNNNELKKDANVKGAQASMAAADASVAGVKSGATQVKASAAQAQASATRTEASTARTEPVVVVDNVSMVFNMANEQLNSFKEYFIKAVKHQLFFREFKALENISITVNKGDVYGIVGTNGSGKSTLLKIIAGVLEPTSGTCSIKGTLAPLIELGAGFDQELTARENVYLNGSLLGYTKEFIDENFQSIIDFAEVNDFVDMPLKNYSSGMVARIAFAIATATVPDILIVDEALSVGDFLFQEKCMKRIKELVRGHGTTLLFVSHSIDQVESLCKKAVWIERGHMRMAGDVRDVCEAYRALENEVKKPGDEQEKAEEAPRIAQAAFAATAGTRTKLAQNMTNAWKEVYGPQVDQAFGSSGAWAFKGWDIGECVATGAGAGVSASVAGSDKAGATGTDTEAGTASTAVSPKNQAGELKVLAQAGDEISARGKWVFEKYKIENTFAGLNRFSTATKIGHAEALRLQASNQSSAALNAPDENKLALKMHAIEGVIVVNGMGSSCADALSAAGLSGVLGFPLIMLDGSKNLIGDDAKRTIEELSCGKEIASIIIGSTDSISAKIELELAQLCTREKPIRLSGKDRYKTNQLIYEAGEHAGKSAQGGKSVQDSINAQGGKSVQGGFNKDYAVVVSGLNFGDGLCMASFCVAKKAPLFMVAPNDSAAAHFTAKALSEGGYSEVLVYGTEDVITPDDYAIIEKALAPGSSICRIAGKTGYESMVSALSWQLERGMTLNGAGFATGANFPDSLIASSLLGPTSSVLCLVSPDDTQNEALYNLLAQHGASVQEINVFGDDGAITKFSRQCIKEALGGVWRTQEW